MEWDLGLQGLVALVALSLAFGALAGLLVGDDIAHRLDALGITALVCFALGFVVSEVVLGWATSVDPEPHIDGLSRNGVLLAGAVTTAVVVLVLRRPTHRGTPSARGRVAGGR